MPRRGTAPATRRDRPCRTCGADEWHQTPAGVWRCVPCRRRQSRESKRKREKDPARRLFRSARARAQERGIEFTITEADVRAAFPADWCCPVLGTPMSYGYQTSHDASPTLDRVNPEWGYVPGNIAVMSYRANRAKGAMRAAELERIVTWMRGQGLA